VVKYLASGGMAQLLLAKSSGIEGFERYVVVKRIHPERAREDHVVNMFLDEARLAASLHHTNIVQVYDIGQERGEYFFAMDYIHGEDLRRILTVLSQKNGTLPIEHIITIVMSAAAALHYAHQAQGTDRKPLHIVHRDVSPANIIVGYDGNVKVVDFGIAKAALRSSETQSGTLKGKIAYMSPEQCMGETIDRRSDVFALGIVLYELLTVRRLFKGTSDFLTMSAIVAGNVPKPSEHRPDVPPELEAICLKALAHIPSERYQTAEAMRGDLEQFAADRSLRTSTAKLAEWMANLFGGRPEPWLVDGELPKVSSDFDRADTGLAEAPSSAGRRLFTPPPGSLLARARRKLASPIGVPIMAVAEPAKPPSSDWGNSPTAQLAAPIESTPPPPARRGRMWIAVAAGVPLAILLAVIATRVAGSGGADASQAAVAPPPPPAVTEEAATVPKPPPPPPPQAAPVPIVSPPPTTPPPAKTAAKKPGPAKKKPPPASTKKWDPTKLLP
jgi:serine/threonine protein kinase